MKITVWGCRGSLPVPGRSTLKYGGNTTCLEVRLDSGQVIILDAGTGIRSLGKKLAAEKNLREIFLILTHSHWDHLMGFPFFIPAYSTDFKINVRGGPIAKDSVKSFLEHQMEPPYFPVRFNVMRAQFEFTHGIPKVKEIGDAIVTPIPLSHPNGGYGFKIEEKGSSFVFLTDNELQYEHEGGRSMYEYANFCRDADLLIHDAQYTMKEYERFATWGHSTYRAASDLAVNAGVKQLCLCHHDPDHKDEDIDKIIDVSNQWIDKRKSNVHCFALEEGATTKV